MRSYRPKTGPFLEGVYYKEEEFNELATDELHAAGLLPLAPEPIWVGYFIEERFGLFPDYEDLPSGVLGYTRFGPNGADRLVVSRSLTKEPGRAAERLVTSTLAHEAGHMLLHSHLFALKLRNGTRPMFEDGLDFDGQSVQCVGDPRVSSSASTGLPYDGSWWEYQANRMIGALLLPKTLVSLAIERFLSAPGGLGSRTLRDGNRDAAARQVAETFDVNPAVARIRINGLFQKTAQRPL